MTTLPLDVAQVRTLFLMDQQIPTTYIAAVSTTSAVARLAILFSEAASKRRILLDTYKHLSPETTSSPYSRIVL
jgi:hypothetical protein